MRVPSIQVAAALSCFMLAAVCPPIYSQTVPQMITISFKLIDQSGNDIVIEEVPWKTAGEISIYLDVRDDKDVVRLRTGARAARGAPGTFSAQFKQADLQNAVLTLAIHPHSSRCACCAGLPYVGEMKLDVRNAVLPEQPVPVKVRKVEGGKLVFKLVSAVTGEPVTRYNMFCQRKEKLGDRNERGEGAYSDEDGIISFDVPDRLLATVISTGLLAEKRFEQFAEFKILPEMYDPKNQPWVVKSKRPYVIGEFRIRNENGKAVPFTDFTGPLPYNQCGVLGSTCQVEKGRFGVVEVGEKRGKLQFFLPDLLSAFCVVEGEYGPEVGAADTDIKKHIIVLERKKNVPYRLHIAGAVDKRPVKDAKLSLVENNRVVKSVVSTDQGVADLGVIQMGDYAIRVEHPSFVRMVIPLKLLQATEQRVVLTPYVESSVHVLDENGRKMPGVAVTVYIRSETGKEQLFELVNAEGKVRFARVPYGEHTVAVMAVRAEKRQGKYSLRWIGRHTFTPGSVLSVKLLPVRDVEVIVTLPPDTQPPFCFHLVDAEYAVKAMSPVDFNRDPPSLKLAVGIMPRRYKAYAETIRGWYLLGEVDAAALPEKRRCEFSLSKEMLDKPLDESPDIF